MVELKNITDKNGVLSCDYFPEHSNEGGHIEIDKTTMEVTRQTYSSYPRGKQLYFSAAVYKLRGFIGQKDVPKTAYAVFM